MNVAEKIRGLYLITDEEELLTERVSAALPYTAALQYRPKILTGENRLEQGRQLARLCRQHGTLFIVNDDPHLALELDADGVHLGQEDGNPVAARELLGSNAIVGISTHSTEEALRAVKQGADYIGFGAVFPTVSKAVQHMPGTEQLAETRKAVTLPIVAIGGITRDNAPDVIDTGADAIAVISAVMSAREPSMAAAELNLLFNRQQGHPKGGVLTIAGSDSGGGAGIQADLKTITLLGSYGASAITALTAQNTLGVTAIHAAPPEFVAAELDAVLTDLSIDVIKTGMLFSAEIIRTVAGKISSYDKRFLIVDPVMIAKGGADLIGRDAVSALREELLPLTYLLTPNIPEAEALTGITISSMADMQLAAEKLHAKGVRNVLVKGGHATGSESIDLLFDGSTVTCFAAPRIDSVNTHGTGCTLSAAIATFLAQGVPLPRAIRQAKEFITTAIRLAVPLGKGHGPVNHYLAAADMHKSQGGSHHD